MGYLTKINQLQLKLDISTNEITRPDKLATMQIRPFSPTSDRPYSDADGSGIVLRDLQQGVKEHIPICL